MGRNWGSHTSDRPATWEDFLEVTREMELKMSVPPEPIVEEPFEVEIEEPAPFVDTSVGDMEPSINPDDMPGLVPVESDEDFERRYKPPVEIFLGQPGHPDELADRVHLGVLGEDFPVQLGPKKDPEELAEELAASYGG